MSRKYKKIIDDEYKQSRDYFRKAIEEQYQKDINKKTGTHSTLDDIAPVKKKEKERTWFDTGAFDDGYQIGDVTKTILGTTGEAASTLMEGVANMGHNLAAFTAGGVAEAADFLGKDEYADKIRNRLAGKDEETNEFLNKYSPVEKFKDAGDYFGKNSVTGEKTDNLIASVGTMAGAMAMGPLGLPAMGLQAAGGELQNAYAAGATPGEAWKSAAVTGISEMVIERLSGGISFGTKTLDELWKEPLTRAITNRTTSTLAKYGLDVLGEGAEEVITEAVQSLGRLSYEDKSVREALFSEEARDNYIEAFIGGGIIGGGFNAKRAYDSVKTGRDYDTGLSGHEQSVIDSEVGKRTTEKQKQAAVDERVNQIIAQREKKFGTTLSESKKRKIRQNVQNQLDNGKLDFTKSEIDKKERAEIEKQVREDFDRGFIDIDSIGDMFSPEKTAQIRDLNIELSKTTNEAKRAEIQTKLDELSKSRLVELDSRLEKDVYLKESLKQEVLKGMEFTRETTDNDSEITKSLVESAKSVGMNNTRRMHDLFEYVDKIANHSNYKYEFTNTAELEENAEKLKIDEKGTRANGMVVEVDGEKKVLINVDSNRALNFIIGHETGHVVESAGEYAKLQKLAKEYAISKDDYEHRLKSVSKLYEGMNADIEKEVTADLIGEYLFTDEQFIKELTAERNVFQKIYDYVKRAYKMATAGSREKRELEKVKRSFEKAYKEISKTTTQQTKDNLATDADSNTYSLSDSQGRQLSEGQQEYFEDSKIRDENGNLKVMYHGSPENFTVFDKKKARSSGYYGRGFYFTDSESHAQQYGNRYETYLNIVNPLQENTHNITKDQLRRYVEAIAENEDYGIENYGYGATVDSVTESVYGKDDFAMIMDLNATSIGDMVEAVELFNEVNGTNYDGIIAPTETVAFYPNQIKNVDNASPTADPDIRYSLSDSDGRKLTKNQQEYFKDSVVRDENGNLLRMYHGTSNAGHTVFDPWGKAKYGLFGTGSYFTDDPEVAISYTEKGKGKNPDVYEVYLNITNPIDMDAPGSYEAWSKALPDADFPKTGTNEDFYRAMEEYFEDDGFTKWEAAETARDVIEGMGYDGITHIGGGRFNKADETRHRVYIAFQPEQIKNFNNENPTADPDIRFSLSAPVEQGKELVAVHNMQSSELMKTLDLGGFPMPSIAIIKAESGHSEFGDVSIVFGKDTIDPKKKANKLYGGDAWTPTYPRVEYKVNSKVEKELNARLNKILYEIPETFRRGVQRLTNETESLLNSHEGEAGMLKWYANDYDMKQAFLAENGQAVPLKHQRTEKKTNELEAKAFEKYLSEIPEAVEDSKVLSGRDWTTQYGEQIKEIYTRFLVEEGISETDAKVVVDSQNKFFWPNQARKAFEYRETGGVEVTESPDYKATNEEIDSRIDQAEYESWLKGLLTGIEEKSGIRNNADPFTPSGNRRSWEALHWEHNLENVVKAMKQGQNGEGFFGGNIFGISAKEYRSIAEMKADSSRLEKMDPEEYESIKDSYTARLQEIATSIMDKTASNQFIAADNAMQAIVEAVRTSRTKSGILNVLKEYPQLTVTETTANDIADLVNDISNMPTGYFEAKPRRAVGFDEIEAVIIPDNTDAALVSRLEEGGYNVIQYEAGNEADRAAKLNDLDELKFSLSHDAAPTGSYNVYRSDVLMPEAQTAPEAPTETPAEAPVEEIAPVVIPEELRYEEGRPLTEEDLPNFEKERSWSFDSITEADVPEEIAPIAPEYEPEIEPVSPLEAEGRDMKEVGKRNVKAYMYENPEVRPFFQREAQYMLNDLRNSVKGEKHYNDELYYISGGEQGFYGTKRQTSDEIAYLLDNFKYTYADIEKGLKAIIEDHGAENNAISKRIEFMLDERLREGYTDAMYGDTMPPDQEYLDLLREKQITEYSDEAYEAWLKTIDFNEFAPMEGVQKQYNPDTGAFEGDVQAEAKAALAKARTENKLLGRESNFDSHDFTVSRGVQQEYDLETEEIVDDTHDIELERLEKRKQKALDDLGDLTSYTKQQAQALYDEVRMMQKGKKVSGDLGFILDRMFEGVDKNADNYEEVKDATYKRITDALLAIERSPAKPEREVPPAEKLIRNSIETKYGWRVSEIEGMKLDTRAEERRKLRKQLIGVNLTEALDKAKNISMMLMNNTDTIRNTELVFGRENGKIINEAIFQKEIDNEAKSIAWQNKERAEIKELGIKARSKESAAVQKYGEKQYVNEFGDLVKYGDDELAAEFSDVETQAKIRKAARIIREKYDAYIDLANETLTKLGFDPIKKRSDYMRHFQELNDVFSRYGIPFNAEAMQEHDLPTDINGLTDSWSPQKNYFANMQPRKGQRTTLDAVTGIDGYIGGIANLIYHTEDIQRGRAFEEIIRETYGQEKGWENLEKLEGLSPEEYQARADKIQDNHLSNYAAWVHEWTNNVAGKKSKVDRSIESMFGRKAFALLDQVRKQVGSNMIGMNLSSSLTNLISPVQAASKTKKLAVVKGTADTIKNIFVKDDFMEKNSFLTARMGTDMLSKTAWQKVQDAGYIFMKGLDWFSSNQIVRSKYYELLSKGMTEEQAHAEAGKFAARIMGDRTKGAQAQLYNSKLIGLVTQFQLEVNNQLYSMFYDTYHESKETAKGNAARTAAGMTFTLGQLAALTHVFGKTFESIAGYNPTFDIIGIIATALGAGEDDDEKTTSERLKAAADKLVDALPYVNVLTGGGRIPIASGIPNLVGVATGGKDDYGNELTLEDELAKLRYLVLPTGGNQIKKTTQGLSMFDEDLPVSGSYTDSGNLRFPVEDTPFNRAQAAIFGQWASGNAQKYFDQERQPLKEKQIQEYKDLDIPIADYWEYRDGLKGLKTVEEKFDYVAGLDLPVSKKNIMINNIVDRDEKVDLINYDDFGSYEEFDWATKNPEKYDYLQSIGASYKDYAASEESKKAYNWAYENPEGYTVSRAVSDVVTYRQISGSLYDIKADKDEEGKSISGSRKEKVADYINGLELDYGAKLILFKSEYPSYDDANMDIIDYLNEREDISYNDMVTILTELEFTVDAEGNIYW